MIALTGTYADHCNGPLPDKTLQYVCRVKYYKDLYYNMIGEPVNIRDGDVLLACGKATWFALYRENANVDLPDTAAQDSASKSNSPAVSG